LNTQPKLAARSGIAQSHISRILNQQNAATIEMIQQIARAFRRKPGDLIEAKPQPHAVNEYRAEYAIKPPAYQLLCELLDSASEAELQTALGVVKAVLDAGRGSGGKAQKHQKKRAG
jgi:transcriptional regulator with XRE-family HTH domain